MCADKNDVKEETASDKESSDSASSLDEESDDEVNMHGIKPRCHPIRSCQPLSTASVTLMQEHDSSESASTSGSDSGATIAAATVCDVLHVSSDKRALSALQRKQISNALKNQLADLKVQQASKP